MTDPEADASPASPGPIRSGVPLDTEYVVGPGLARRMSRAFVRFSALTPRVLIRVLLGIALISVGAPFLGIPWLAVVSIGLLLWAFMLYLGYLRIRRRMLASVPVGAVYASGFGVDAMAFRSPLASSEVKYRAYESVTVRDGFVFLKARNARLYLILPIELFPGDSVDLVRRKVGEAPA